MFRHLLVWFLRKTRPCSRLLLRLLAPLPVGLLRDVLAGFHPLGALGIDEYRYLRPLVLREVAPLAVEAPDKLPRVTFIFQDIRLYAELWEAGVEVLLDDRPENPGVKFNDADLIGIPLRLTLGQRSLDKGQVELKLRCRDERVDVEVEEVVSRVKAELAKLQQELDEKVVEVPYKK